MTEPTTPDTRTVQLRLPAAVEEQLRAKATDDGLSLEAYLEVVAEQVASGKCQPAALALAVKRRTSRTPEQILADREEVMKTARRGRPLPEGKTLFDVVVGLWPGDETDEEIYEMLEKLS